MTIKFYYFTIGFKIQIQHLIELFDTEKLEDFENFVNKEYEKNQKQSLSEDLQKYLDMGRKTHWLLINGKKYIIRTYQHCDSEYAKYVIIGVKVGKMNRWTASIKNNKNLKVKKSLLIYMMKNENVKYSVRNTPYSMNCKNYINLTSGILNICNFQYSYVPSIFTTTNSCDCCN